MSELRYDPIHPDVPPTPGPDTTSFTPNYKLLLNLGNTITSWLTIFNTNMALIDNAMHNLELRTSIDGDVPPEAINEIIRLSREVAELQETVKQLPKMVEQITNLQTQTTTNITDINTLKINYTNLDTMVATINVTLQAIQTSLDKLEANYVSLEARVKALEDKTP